MIFEIENTEPKHIEKFSLIEKSLKSLKSYGPKSFASLTNDNGDFTQVAGGRVTCMVEHNLNGKSMRAYLEKPRVSFKEPHELVFGAGKLILKPDEFLYIDDVINIFHSFFYSKNFPQYISWRSS